MERSTTRDQPRGRTRRSSRSSQQSNLSRSREHVHRCKAKGEKWTEILQSHRHSLAHCAPDRGQGQKSSRAVSADWPTRQQVTLPLQGRQGSLRGVAPSEWRYWGKGAQPNSAGPLPATLLGPLVSHPSIDPNHCVVVNILQRPLDRSGLVHPRTDDRA